MKLINTLLTGALLGGLTFSVQAEQKWTVLFDGKKVTGLRGYGQKAFPEKAWKVENGLPVILSSALVTQSKFV